MRVLPLILLCTIFSLTLPACGDDEDLIEITENGSQKPNADSCDSSLIGNWYNGGIYKGEQDFYFLNGGEGYWEYVKYDNDWGYKRKAFTWSTKDSVLTINYVNQDNPTVYKYSIDGKQLSLTSSNNKTTLFTQSNNNGTTKVDYTQKPFANNYIYDKVNGIYYEITKVVEKCEHAKSGDKTNWQYLYFYGSDGRMDTSGLAVFYTTPYYDGIDSYWREGTYTMSSTTSYYSYTSNAWTNGSKRSTYSGDKLKIKKNGNISTYDYNGSDIELHFVGTVK